MPADRTPSAGTAGGAAPRGPSIDGRPLVEDRTAATRLNHDGIPCGCKTGVSQKEFDAALAAIDALYERQDDTASTAAIARVALEAAAEVRRA